MGAVSRAWRIAAFSALLFGGRVLAQGGCGLDVHYGLVYCYNEGEHTWVDNDTCTDPGPPDYLCAKGTAVARMELPTRPPMLVLPTSAAADHLINLLLSLSY